MKKKTAPQIKVNNPLRLALMILVGFHSAFGQTKESSVRQLKPNQTIEREMTGAESHYYKVDLRTNEFFQVRLEQKGVDVTLKLLDQNGNILATMDSPNGKEGSETLTFVAAMNNSYVLEISGSDQNATKGYYTIERKVSRTATAQDKRRVAVERLFVEGLKNANTEGQLEAAINLLSEALLGWEELKDDYRAQLTAKQVEQLKAQPNVQLLPVGKTVERPLKGSGRHFYPVHLRQGRIIRIYAEEKGVDIQLVFARATNSQLVKKTDFSSGYGYEALTCVVEHTDDYMVLIGSGESLLSGSYVLAVTVGDSASVADTEHSDAEQLLTEAIANQKGGSPDELQKAVTKGQRSLALWSQLGEKYWEGYTNNFLGSVYLDLGEHQKAFEYYEKALLLRRMNGDKDGEGWTLTKIGNFYLDERRKLQALECFEKAMSLFKVNGDRAGIAESLLGKGLVYSALYEWRKALEHLKLALSVLEGIGEQFGKAAAQLAIGVTYSKLGEKQNALDYLSRSLRFFRTIENRNEEAIVLNQIGIVYADLDQYQEALKHQNEALLLRRKVGDRGGEARTLNNIGLIYSDLDENQKALAYHQEALSLRKAIGDKLGEGATLNNIALVYAKSGDYQKALEYYNDALALRRVVEDSEGEGITLSAMGVVNLNLGEIRKAFEYLDQALLIHKRIGDRDGEASVLSNLGLAHKISGNRRKALEFYIEALPLRRAIGDRSGEAITLSNIGSVYADLGENQEALASYNQALALHRLIGNRSGEATVLNNIGLMYDKAHDYKEALKNVHQALLIFRAIGTRSNEATTLSNAMSVWESLGNRRMAIFFGKLSINKLQSLRGSARSLDNETQKSFARSINESYKKLAELLIEDGQLEQAVEVLNFYQDQRFFDLDHDNDTPVKQTTPSPREQSLIERYETEGTEFGQIGSQLEDLKQSIGIKPNEQESFELAQLEAALKTASSKFFAVFEDAAKDFGKPRDKQDALSSVEEVEDFQKTLETISRETKQNAVALHTLIGEKNFHLLLVSPKGIESFASAIGADDFDSKVSQFYALLQSDDYDPSVLGKELYNLILKPVTTELKKQNAQTLLWSLDGTLRYVPMGALWDGEKYIVERYRNVIFTRAEPERMTRNVSEVWTGVGFGSSRDQEIVLGGEGENKFHFNALESMDEELNGVFRTRPASVTGLLTGKIFTDEQFTKDVFYQELATRPPVVHISSHFFFYPGDYTRSFLVLGKGNALTMSEMKEHRGLFDGVELLTLSACKTAATKPDSYGKEIDGFAELAQRLGAGAVMATLWEVNEESTAQLMTRFYENRQIKHLNKAAALGEAQRDLLHGSTPASPTSRRGTADEDIVVDEKYLIPFKPDPKRPLAHPYYWAPFVLFGNWK